MGSRMKRATAAGAAVALVLGLAACGDDDDDASTATTEADAGEAAAGDLTTFCDSLVEFNELGNQNELDEESSEEDVQAYGEQVRPVWDRIADNAPADAQDAVDELGGAIDDLEAGDAEAFGSDDTFVTYSALLGDVADDCAWTSQPVTAIDYAFEGVPSTIPAGTVVFQMTNASEGEDHEMIIAGKAAGVTQSFDEILEMSEEESESLVTFEGAAFAPPGGDATALTDLEPGEYVMVCFVPVGGAEDGAPHFTEGMKTEFTVE